MQTDITGISIIWWNKDVHKHIRLEQIDYDGVWRCEVMKWAVVMLQTPSCNKPLLEKRRRARINRSLDQLKLLLLESSHQQVGHQHNGLLNIIVIHTSTQLCSHADPTIRITGLTTSEDKRVVDQNKFFTL